MAWIRENVDALVRSIITPTLFSSYTSYNPLIAVLMGRSAEQLDKIGNPTSGVVLSGAPIHSGTQMLLSGSQYHEFRYQKDQLADAAYVGLPGTNIASIVGGSTGQTPASSKFAEDLVGTSKHAWTQRMVPVSIRQDTIDNANNAGGSMGNILIANAVEEAYGFAYQNMVNDLSTQLWTGTVTLANQANAKWTNYLGIDHAVSDGTDKSGGTGDDDSAYDGYGAVDRTVETELASNHVGADDICASSTTADLGIIRKLKHESGGTGWNAINHKAVGPGVADLAITTPAIFLKLAEEMEAGNQKEVDATRVVDFFGEGFTTPVLNKDGVMITYDPNCPAGKLYLLSTRSWYFEVHNKHNFATTPLVEDWKNNYQGGYYQWSLIDLKSRLVCKEPWLQAKVVNLTV